MCDPSPVGLGLCLSGTTVIALADGTSRTIAELAHAGVDVNVLAVDINGTVLVRRMRHPRRTEAHAQVLRVTLLTGAWFDCTSGHELRQASGVHIAASALGGSSQLWFSVRDGETIVRADGERYRAFGAAGVPNDYSNRRITRTCEQCQRQYQVNYAQRSTSHCGPECSTLHAHVRRTLTEASKVKFTGVLVSSIAPAARADVYNAVVDEYHNVCLVMRREGDTNPSDTLICVNTL